MKRAKKSRGVVHKNASAGKVGQGSVSGDEYIDMCRERQATPAIISGRCSEMISSG